MIIPKFLLNEDLQEALECFGSIKDSSGDNDTSDYLEISISEEQYYKLFESFTGESSFVSKSVSSIFQLIRGISNRSEAASVISAINSLYLINPSYANSLLSAATSKIGSIK